MQLDAYQIDAVLGTGSGTRVLAARDAAGARVLVKVFEECAGLSAPDIRRDREASAHRIASGAPVPPLVAVGDSPIAGPYLVTRFESGVSLRAMLSAAPLLPEHATAIVGQVADGLARLHERGLVHGDLKPEHVFVGSDGWITLIDLGLASPIGARATGSEESTDGARSVSGTLGYIAPECFESLPISPAIDVFALGVVLHESLVGARPFVQTIDGRSIGAPLPLHTVDPRIDEDLSALVRVCLSSSPGDRPSAVAIRATIDRVDDRASRSERLAELVADPARAQRDAIARARARLLTRAETQIDDGDAFAATRTLDRALAYVADDPAALAALERAMALAPRPRRRSRRVVSIALVVLGLALTGIVVGLRRSATPPPASGPDVPTAPRVEGFVPLPASRIPNATFVQGAARERQALRALDARLRERPDDVEARLRRAEKRRSLGRLRDAHADLLTLLASHPDEPRVLRALVALYDRLGESARTAPLLERIVESSPRDVTALTDLSIALGEGTRSAEAINQAYAIAPRDPRVLARRCSLAVHGAVDAATSLARCDEARSRSPRDPFVLADRAEAALRAGDLDEAHAMLTAAIALRPEDPELYFRRADLEQSRDDPEGAAATRARACRLAPDPRCEAIEE